MQQWKRNLYTVWFTQLLSLMGFGFGLPFLPFFIQDLGVSDPAELKLWTGILASAPAVTMAVMAPVWGALADRVGKKTMLIRAMFGGMAVLIGTGLAQSVYQVLLFRILQGLLTGTVTSSAALVASGTPDNKLSYALGFISSSTFIGWSLGPAAGGLIAEQFGYRTSFFIGSGILFIGLLLVILLITEPAKTPDNPDSEKTDKMQSDTNILSFSFGILFLLFFMLRICRTLPTPFLPLYIQELRGTIEGSARITGLLSGGIGCMSAVSGLTLSRLGDRYDKLKLMTVLLGAGFAASTVILFSSSFAALAATMMATYFFIGGIEPLLMSLTSQKVASKNRGLLFGIQTAVGSVAWFASPMLGSWVSIEFSLDTVFILFTALLAATMAASAAVRRRLRKRTYSSI